MSLVLLIPGVGMGGGAAATPSSEIASAHHHRRGVWQPDVPTITGSGVS